MSTNQPLKHIALKSGRSIAARFLVEGEPNKIVFFCHPTPGAGNLIPNLEETVKRGATLISIDRAGYGRSSPAPHEHWPSVSEAAEELAKVIESIATEPVGIAGWSTGGWVASALAANRPDLVDRLALVATPAPESEQPWLLPEIKQALGYPNPPTQQLVEQNLRTYLNSQPPSEIGRTLLGVSDADAKALAHPHTADALAAMIEESFTQGDQAMINEIAGFNLRPWGFTPSDIQAKTLCLYGTKDPLTPHRHGKWWQKQLPNARLEMSPNTGHLLIFPMWKRVLSYLLPKQRKQSK